jgi:predicted MPP superfamily phosphohydrolase
LFQLDFKGRRPFSITRYELSIPAWVGGPALRVVLLADLHACNPWMGKATIERLVRQTNALEPDLVLLLGDYATGMPYFMTSPVPDQEWANILAGLEAPLGRFAVMGNHDWWEDREAQRRGGGPISGQLALDDVGISVLENDAIRVTRANKPFWVAGLGDQQALLGPRRFSRAGRSGVDDLAKTLNAVDDDGPVILMAHEPDIFPEVLKADRRVAVTVSGHTHGGQVRLFGYSPVVPS